MKSYTDLEQSKKLSEILPLKSADMYYFLDPTPAGNIYHLVVQRIDFGVKTREPEYNKGDISCWSLAALLRIIPKHIKDFNVLRIDIGEKDFAIWYDEIGYGVNTELPNITTECPINACYETILKLHEQKML